MLTPTSIVSLKQGKVTARSEEDYYRQMAGWQAPKALGSVLGWLRPSDKAATDEQDARLRQAGAR